MAQFDVRTYKIIERLQKARLSLMMTQPFYAILLMNMKFALDLSCSTAYTSGDMIAFNPDFIDDIDDNELEFVLMHEVLHVVLGHVFRHQSDYEMEEFDMACDIVVNSNILYSFNMDPKKITLKKYGESMHLLPNGDEGYKYSMEEVYKILLAQNKKKENKQSGGNKGKGSPEGYTQGHGNGNGHGVTNTEDEKFEGAGRGNGIGNDKTKSQKSEKNHTPPTLEELIASIKSRNDEIRESLKNGGGENKNATEDVGSGVSRFDDHTFWEGDDEMNSQRAVWIDRMIKATDILDAFPENVKGRGTIPAAIKRIINELKKPKLDWKTILNDFIQEEICDYSFAPPDRRMQDSPFFLPDFNEKDEKAKDILFMIDTSGSMSDDAITECYSEIYGAIQQFNGKLTGFLGFFDAVVVEPVPFEDEDEFKIIRPKGGGGTSFHVIFEYVKEKMEDSPPTSIVILTDGYAPFPSLDDTMGIPVLWIINNEEVNPPWGKVARIPNGQNNN